MDIRENCDQWIDLAYGDWLRWLRKQKKKTFMRESTRNIVDKMFRAVDNRNEEEASQTSERLRRFADTFNGVSEGFGVDEYLYESSEIYLECALASYRMNDLQDALALMKIPIGGFPNHTLHKAISYWVCGCVQWQFQAHVENALISWEKSLQIVKDAEAESRNDLSFVKKCLEIQERMTEAIRFASSNMFAPPVSRRTKNANTDSKGRSARLWNFPYFGDIPAGQPAWVSPEPEAYSEVEAIILNDAQYNFYSLRNELIINLPIGKMHFLLRAKGDSMNTSSPIPIKDGDLVLLRQQDAAESGEIVAVEIVGVDEVATLKRYRYKDRKHWLEPESDNPDLPPHFSITKDFYIRGVALAVLKPV